jgi:hypothetical protein
MVGTSALACRTRAIARKTLLLLYLFFTNFDLSGGKALAFLRVKPGLEAAASSAPVSRFVVFCRVLTVVAGARAGDIPFPRPGTLPFLYRVSILAAQRPPKCSRGTKRWRNE